MAKHLTYVLNYTYICVLFKTNLKPTKMKTTPTIGTEVVRSTGDYVVGRIGNVVAIDTDKNRVQVAWKGATTTWVSVNAVEPTSIHYKIVKTKRYPKYERV